MNVDTDTLLAELPPYRDQWVTIADDQTVSDIIEEILDAHAAFAPYYDKIALYFSGGSTRQIADRLYNYCKKNIRYYEESKDDQTTALPAGILSRGRGDCKHFASFCGGILDGINRAGKKIKWCYRFASYRLLDSEPHHVFIVVFDGDKELWIDPTPMSEKQSPYWLIDETIKADNSNNMALRRNIAGIDQEAALALQPFEQFELPAGGTPVWINGQWYIQMHDNESAIGQLDLVSTGLSVIKDITTIFAPSDPGNRAAQKVFAMFPLPPNANAATIQNVLNAIIAHENNDSGLDSEWIAAYADIKRQYNNALAAVQAGKPAPVIVPPTPGMPSYTGLPPQVTVQPGTYSSGGLATMFSGSAITYVLIAAAAYFLLKPKRA